MHDAGQFLGCVELQPRDDAKAVAQRVGQHAGAGGGAYQGEGLQVEFDGACGGAFADHDVDLKVLQRGVEDFFHHGAQAVDLVDEKNVVLFQVGEDGGEVFGFFQHRPRGLPQVHAEFVGDDVGEGGFAQAGWAKQQHMVHGLGAFFGRANEDLQLLAHLGLADILGEALGPQRAFNRFFIRRCRRRSHDAPRGLEVVGLNGHGCIIARRARDAACLECAPCKPSAVTFSAGPSLRSSR